jgi:hypothetical protein
MHHYLAYGTILMHAMFRHWRRWERKLDVFFFARKAQDVRWEVVSKLQDALTFFRSNLIFCDLSTHTQTQTQTMAHHHHHPLLSQHQYSSHQPWHGTAVMQMGGQVGHDRRIVITPLIVRGILPSPWMTVAT